MIEFMGQVFRTIDQAREILQSIHIELIFIGSFSIMQLITSIGLKLKEKKKRA